jgi:hypothetical protein
MPANLYKKQHDHKPYFIFLLSEVQYTFSLSLSLFLKNSSFFFPAAHHKEQYCEELSSFNCEELSLL